MSTARQTSRRSLAKISQIGSMQGRIARKMVLKLGHVNKRVSAHDREFVMAYITR